ncbi:SGNH/GDSL hydrolase family protein [Ligilactobacillus acidipiscis]|uniref:SGNH/GDSL hydrolase family protein n=1 Tax=Ligilactobacillus acidipiscis TaxID=89059 RepID=UPI0023F86934|nr:SGNH/GDSL hydrolase family protein [Ligilactobacillus acidipiscis]WEV55843.1 SGNH/GDSL hydrolase family protein [Ligilactobacillus acidipiscis]
MKKITEISKFLITLLALSCIFFGIFYFLARPHQDQSSQPEQTAHTETKKHKETKLTDLTVIGLGDSLTYGVGDTQERGGYVYLLKQKLLKNDTKSVTDFNFGKTGDTTTQIKQRLDSQAEIKQQLKKADVITVTAGGNDLMHVLQNNFQTISSNHFNDSMQRAKDSYRLNMTALLKDIRATNSKAPIFLFSVYDPFYVYFPGITALQKYTSQWNKVAAEQVKQLDSTYFVDVERQLSEGQYYGKSKVNLKKSTNADLSQADDKNLEKLLSDPKEKNDYLSAEDHFHPNDDGYQLMTKKLYETMLKHKETWFKETQ